MGLAKNPELFRCGFEWVGVTDFALVHDISELTQSDEWLKYGWPAMIGDKDSELPSPLASAARIRQPLLMAYGRLDSTVRIEQGHKFRDAVTATNNNVEYIEYPLEGHGWYIEEDNIDFWRHVEKFLQANLRGASN